MRSHPATSGFTSVPPLAKAVRPSSKATTHRSEGVYPPPWTRCQDTARPCASASTRSASHRGGSIRADYRAGSYNPATALKEETAMRGLMQQDQLTITGILERAVAFHP